MTNWCFAVQILIAQEVWSTATEIASPQGKVIKNKVTNKVINVGSDTFGNPIFQKGLQN